MAFTNLQQFNAGLDRFQKKVEGRALLFHKKVAFMVLGAYITGADGRIRPVSGLLHLTPVDTGRAVGNYQVSIGSPASGAIDAGFGASSGDPSKSRIGATGPQAAKATAAASRALTGLKLGQTIWIVNNLPYIRVLNDGDGGRQAHHMLERALANTRASLRAA